MSNRKRDVFTALCLSLFIISFAVCFITFFKPLYYLDIDRLNIVKYSCVAKDIIIKNYNILIDYLSIFYKGDLYFPNFRMSPTGKIHFEEVKVIFQLIQLLMISSGLLSGVLIYFRHKEKEYRYLRLASIFSTGVPIILGLVACADFESSFLIFHKIFFRNEYYVFDLYDDAIINILPQEFFMHCFIAIIGVVVVLSLLCYIIYRRYEKRVLGENGL